jgi:hypothetical protein
LEEDENEKQYQKERRSHEIFLACAVEVKKL